MIKDIAICLFSYPYCIPFISDIIKAMTAFLGEHRTFSISVVSPRKHKASKYLIQKPPLKKP